MSQPLLIPPAINLMDLDYWAEVVATPLHLLECLAPGPDPDWPTQADIEAARERGRALLAELIAADYHDPDCRCVMCRCLNSDERA